MLVIRGSARNLSGLVVGGCPYVVPNIEVILVGVKPFYGFTNDGKIGKSAEAETLRFNSSPEGLRHLAERLMEYADEAEEVVGTSPSREDVPVDCGNKAEPIGPAPPDEPVASH